MSFRFSLQVFLVLLAVLKFSDKSSYETLPELKLEGSPTEKARPTLPVRRDTAAHWAQQAWGCADKTVERNLSKVLQVDYGKRAPPCCSTKASPRHLQQVATAWRQDTQQ